MSPYLTTLNLDEGFAEGLECLLDGLELRVVGPLTSAAPREPHLPASR